MPKVNKDANFSRVVIENKDTLDSKDALDALPLNPITKNSILLAPVNSCVRVLEPYAALTQTHSYYIQLGFPTEIDRLYKKGGSDNNTLFLLKRLCQELTLGISELVKHEFVFSTKKS